MSSENTKAISSSCRAGLVAKKIGMTSYFFDDGTVMPVTVLQVFDSTVLEIKTILTHGYNSVVIGYDKVDSKKVTKPMLGYFKKCNTDTFRSVKEFRIGSEYVLDEKVLNQNYFQENQFVDVSGISIGKGFAGGMKRWNFRGLEASHGVSVSHRSHGSTGQRQDPGKVFKGKKMAGHMGSGKITIQNLKIIKIDHQNGLIIVGGCVPGAKNSNVFITDSKKKIKVF